MINCLVDSGLRRGRIFYRTYRGRIGIYPPYAISGVDRFRSTLFDQAAIRKMQKDDDEIGGWHISLGVVQSRMIRSIGSMLDATYYNLYVYTHVQGTYRYI